MINFLTLGTNNLQNAEEFYDSVLEPLNYAQMEKKKHMSVTQNKMKVRRLYYTLGIHSTKNLQAQAMAPWLHSPVHQRLSLISAINSLS